MPLSFPVSLVILDCVAAESNVVACLQLLGDRAQAMTQEPNCIFVTYEVALGICVTLILNLMPGTTQLLT